MGTNITKMLALMARAEKYQQHIEEYEMGSLARVAAKREEARFQGSGEDLHDIYHVAKDLDDNFWYNRAVGKRNSYVARATMYGIAAIVMGEEFLPTCTCLAAHSNDGTLVAYEADPNCPVHGTK
jgi:hypothetical protein